MKRFNPDRHSLPLSEIGYADFQNGRPIVLPVLREFQESITTLGEIYG